MSSSTAHQKSLVFDNVAKLCYGKKSSHHYLPLFLSLFRVGVSRSHIRSMRTAISSGMLLTDTANKIATAILHYMYVERWFVIRGQM